MRRYLDWINRGTNWSCAFFERRTGAASSRTTRTRRGSITRTTGTRTTRTRTRTTRTRTRTTRTRIAETNGVCFYSACTKS